MGTSALSINRKMFPDTCELLEFLARELNIAFVGDEEFLNLVDVGIAVQVPLFRVFFEKYGQSVSIAFAWSMGDGMGTVFCVPPHVAEKMKNFCEFEEIQNREGEVFMVYTEEEKESGE
jgi:hypothetical protein